jgi:poly(hydroxyalkanoate) granule-associated protein
VKKTLKAMEKKRGELVGAAEEIGQEVTTLGRRSWLATLGVIATVEAKATETFETLVEKGQELDGLDRFENALSWTRKQAKSLASRVNSAVEHGSEKVLVRVGVPSRKDVRTLIHRVEQLTAKVEHLSARRA